MMNLSRFFTLLILGAFVAGSSFATTVTVPGNAATINGALELIDYNDGQADVVLISPKVDDPLTLLIDESIYDEQVFPKGNAGNDSTAFPSSGGLSTGAVQAAIGDHTDPLTLRGSDPNNPPIIQIVDYLPSPYGMFPGNPGDFFFSTFVYGAHNVTCENIELRSNGPDYAKNGMATNHVWQDCLFTNGSGDGGPAQDFCDYNNNRDFNSDIDPLIGLDNSYVYSNCIIDGEDVLDGNGARFGNAFVWWHGYGSGNAAGNAVGSGVTFDNCIAQNWGDIIHNFRANSQGGTNGAPNGLHVADCYFLNAANIFNLDGAMADSEIVRSVFDGGDSPGHLWRMNTREGTARGWISDFVCANNLIVRTKGSQAMNINHGDVINAGATPSWHIVNNTIYDYNAAGAQINLTGASANVGTVNISNNILAASDTVTQGNAINVAPTTPASVVGNISNNLLFNNTTGITNTSNATVGGTVTGDPAFDSTVVNIPAAPPVDIAGRAQNFHPTALAIDAGSNAQYAAAAALGAGNADVDSDTARDGTVDIGAQETNGTSLVAGWDMY